MTGENEWHRVPGKRGEYWKDLVAEKIAERDAILRQYSEIVTPQINVSTTDGLLEQLACGQISAVAVTNYCIALSIKAHEKTNCITEPLFRQALERAEELDQYFTSHGRPIGPLHGLPISLKDQFDVRGIDSTLGWSSLIHRPATHNSVLVDILIRAGAIPFVKTNLPQTIMIAETCNPVFGTTTHPFKAGYSPGGSSGGEGALIASGGSLLGWGTDLGGSIRMPAHLCGLFGLRPSHGRLPYQDVSVTQFGNETVPSVVGPLSSSLDLLETSVKTIIDAGPWRLDPKCLPMPWRPHAPTTYKIGVFWDDGVVAPLPPVSRALNSLVTKLRKAGHDCIDWDAEYYVEMIAVMDELYLVDKGADFSDFLMPGEPIMERVQLLLDKSSSHPGTVHALWKLHQRKQRLQKAYLDKMEAAGVDFLLTPAMPSCAAPVGKHAWWVGYTKFVNLLDLSAIVFPVTTVSAQLDAQIRLDREYRNDFERAAWREWKVHELEGLPIGLQLIGKRLEEEKVIAATRQIMQLLND